MDMFNPVAFLLTESFLNGKKKNETVLVVRGVYRAKPAFSSNC